MTVCLAAINKKHNVIAFSSDRMVTSSYPPIEFEHKLPKIVEMNENCVVLPAGDALRNRELCKTVRARLSEKQASIEDIAHTLNTVYQEKRLKLIEDTVLKSRGLTHDQFVTDGVKIMPLQIYQLIDQIIATFNYNLELIIAGIDTQGPTIYSIRNPGEIECYDSIGFHTIGSGSMHGILSLIETYDPERGIVETLYSVFRAKKVAEVAPGVGKDTDLGMISLEKKIKYFDENADLCKNMDDLLEKEQNTRKSLIDNSTLATMDLLVNGKEALHKVNDGAESATKTKVEEQNE